MSELEYTDNFSEIPPLTEEEKRALEALFTHIRANCLRAQGISSCLTNLGRRPPGFPDTSDLGFNENGFPKDTKKINKFFRAVEAWKESHSQAREIWESLENRETPQIDKNRENRWFDVVVNLFTQRFNKTIKPGTSS
jgi:glutaredoxin